MSAIFDSFPYDDRSMDEQEWKEMMQWIRGDGILTTAGSLSPTGDSAVAPYSDLTLQIYPGLAWIQGFYFTYTEDPLDPGNFLIAVNENLSPNPRIDLIVLRLDLVANNIAYGVLEGFPDPSPVPPDLTQDDTVWEMPIAQIFIASGATVINSGDITDLREQSVQTTITPSFDLNDLTDVVITTPAAGDVLRYDVGTTNWINGPSTLAALYSDSNATATTFTDATSYVAMAVGGAGTLFSRPSGIFTQGTNGILTYNGTVSLYFTATITVSFDASNSATSLDFGFLVNGSLVAGSLIRTTLVTSGNLQSASLTKILQLAPTNVLTIGIRNRSWTVAQTITAVTYNMSLTTL